MTEVVRRPATGAAASPNNGADSPPIEAAEAASVDVLAAPRGDGAGARAPTRRTPANDIRLIDPPERVVMPATDLGGVDVLKHGDLYLLSDALGDVRANSRGLGLYSGDTCVMSALALLVNGHRPTLLRGDSGEGFRGTIQLTNPEIRRHPGDKMAPAKALGRQMLGITRYRIVGEGLRERVTISNFAEHGEEVTVDLLLGAGFADIFEVRGYVRKQVGSLLPIAVDRQHAVFRYLGRDGWLRRTFVSFPSAEIEPVKDDETGASVRLSWVLEIPAGGHESLEWTIWSDQVDHRPGAGHAAGADHEGSAKTNGTKGRRSPAGKHDALAFTAFPPAPQIHEEIGLEAYRAWNATTAVVDSDHELFDTSVRRGLADLRLLENDGPRPGEHYIAAGVPWFTTLFGRDALITAYEAIAFRPQIATEVLSVLAARQATSDDPASDAEPGKILHEIRGGETARTHELPFGLYYGSVDATPLWLILLAETYDWTANRDLVDRLWPNALAALRWIDRFGDHDGDGFVEYGRRAHRGLINQGWKDSADSVRNRKGVTVEGPIALVEVQGYVYQAKVRIARLARMRGDEEFAAQLEAEAATLQARFEDAFWVEDLGTYAMALDGHKKQADAIVSNAGQALWSGIANPLHAARVAERLADRGLNSGWGIRTYAEGQPGFNPIGYHTGTVWPHDNALIVSGLKRYGFDAQANELAGRLLEAAQHVRDLRLPELFCGFDRQAVPVPVPYPVACSPQAWSAAAPLQLLRSMLGFHPHADEARLELVRPHLPTWIGKLTITGLQVGDASVDLLFHRWRGSTAAEVLRKSGPLEVTIRV
ncbi:MAG TPA: glycogen debranching N-terminal domain-containing protein [Candidatus Limnocylindrales bacterium]